jgi:CRP/FNR family transcriptional regulator
MNPLDVLRRYPLFALIPDGVLTRWVAAGQTTRFLTGEAVFREGSPGEWAYVLLHGRVRIVRKGASGREPTLGAIEPGELFGEYALLSPGNNTATCRAVVDSVLFQIPLGPVREWIAGSSGIVGLKSWLQLHFLLRQLRGQSAMGFMSAPSVLAMLPHLATLDVPADTTVQADGLCAKSSDTAPGRTSAR